MGIDDLVHELEVEAEVLRAVSHMSPRAARDFLLRLATKVQRACDGAAGPFVEAGDGAEAAPKPIWYAPPKEVPVEQPPEVGRPVVPLLAAPENAELDARPNKTQTIINVVRARGPMAREDLYAEMARLFDQSFERAKRLTQPLLWQILSGQSPRLRETERGELEAV